MSAPEIVTSFPERDSQHRVAESVRVLLAYKSLSQRDLADYLGHPASMVSKMLNGSRKMTVDELSTLARFFGCTEQNLLDGPQQWVNVGINPGSFLTLIEGSRGGSRPVQGVLPFARHLRPVGPATTGEPA